MNPEYQKSADAFIDQFFIEVKQKFIRDKKIAPAVYFLFYYPDEPEHKFGGVPLPHARDFFASSRHKQYLKGHIQTCWNELNKELKAQNIDYKAELAAVILMSDMYISDLVVPASVDVDQAINKAVLPSKDPARREAIGFNIYFDDHSVTYYYPYKRQLNNIVFEINRIEYGSMFGGTFENLFPKA